MREERAFPPDPHGEVGTPGWSPRQAWMLGAARHHGGHRGRSRFGPPFGTWGAFPGPFFGGRSKVARGDVRAAILVLLAEGPMHGYQVIQELTERSGGMWRPSPGSIYPTLQLLEDEGLVSSETADGRRVFRLTDTGKAEVDKRGKNAPAPWEVSENTGALMDLRMVGASLAAAVMQVAQAGSERQISRAHEILTEARKSLYRVLAEDEPATEPNEDEEDEES